MTIWNDHGAPYLSVWRSVFERLAPQHLKAAEDLIAPVPLGQGTSVREITDELLSTLTEAYRETAAH